MWKHNWGVVQAAEIMGGGAEYWWRKSFTNPLEIMVGIILHLVLKIGEPL